MPSGRTGSEGRDSDLREPPQLKAEVASFLQGSSEVAEDKDKEMLPEPSVSKSTKWVQWRAKKCDIPTGGQNYLQFQRKTQEDWPER